MKNKSADGLRGVAAFNVAIAHFFAAFIPSLLHNNFPTIFGQNNNPSILFELFTSPIVTIFYNGHFAVLVFFALSGYVLTLPYKEDFSSGVEILKRRLWARYFRLNIPIAVAVFISLLVYKLGLYWNVQASELSGSVTWLKNFYPENLSFIGAIKEASFASIISGVANFIPPLWTLKIEFIGSLYILAFYICKPKFVNSAPLLILLAFVYFVHGSESIYYYTIFFGSLIPKLQNKYKLSFFVIGMYFGGFQLNSSLYNFLPGVDSTGWDKKTFYNAVGATLLAASVVNGFLSKFFESKVIQFLGNISFSLYLLHFIILCSVSSFIFSSFPNTKLYLLINLVTYVGLCFFAARIFARYVDVRSIKISNKFSSIMFDQSNHKSHSTHRAGPLSDG